MGGYKPVVGDRVRVKFEGEVRAIYSDGDLRVEGVGHYGTDIPHEAIVSVKKIEPPVTFFKPGDVVRGRTYGGVYLVGSDGRAWTCLKASRGLDRKGATGRNREGWFSSERYELVDLG